MDEMPHIEKVPCIRCGVCCIAVRCERWGDVRDDRGLCEALIIHKEGHTSCKRIIEKKDNPFGKGCLIRCFKEGFEITKEIAEEKAGVKLPGMNQAGGI